MKIDVRTESDITIIKPHGRMDFNGLNEFSGIVKKNVEDGATKILLDFSELEYLSSSGIRTLVECQKKVDSKKGIFAFCALNNQIMELFQIVQLDKVFKIFPSEFEALDKMML